MEALENRSQTQDQKAQMELARLRAELASAAEIAATSRTCPQCGMGVFKTGGCNHMTCSCGCHFCWSCGRDISDLLYDHYDSSGCVIFSDQDVAAARIQDGRGRERVRGRQRVLRQYHNYIADVARERRNEISVCPGCRSLVFKEGSNNHVACHNCNTLFCFLCRQNLKGVKGHFSAAHPQHN
jgi:E3 ubiquitin-protein ligase RNF14